MRHVTDKKEIRQMQYYIQLAAEEAKKSTCKKSQRGAVIVKDDEIIGKGFNRVTFEKLCNPCVREEIKDNSRVELCSAIHAEQMAVIDAVNRGKSLLGSRMYHIKVKDGKMVPCGKPSCTVCSRIIHESGISEFVLWHEEGHAIYPSEELNRLSFEYFLRGR